MNLSGGTPKNLESLSAIILLIGLRPFSMSHTIWRDMPPSFCPNSSWVSSFSCL